MIRHLAEGNRLHAGTFTADMLLEKDVMGNAQHPASITPDTVTPELLAEAIRRVNAKHENDYTLAT
ncbi:hypothetical protein [Nesterenkonia flava]|uniref:Uncharacterized protein n=1 Tax=Nesterenkonia flava TaxID=469799 RepID=A0ABU1FY84_9MICC|nr:hypothetical protein [Nesterenkonia flava]MDR5713118.1 hypothetical protein [Nesterenkonia flava]